MQFKGQTIYNPYGIVLMTENTLRGSIFISLDMRMYNRDENGIYHELKS